MPTKLPRIHIYLSPEEKEIITEEAARAGRSLSTYIREMLFPPPSKKQLKLPQTLENKGFTPEKPAPPPETAGPTAQKRPSILSPRFQNFFGLVQADEQEKPTSEPPPRQENCQRDEQPAPRERYRGPKRTRHA